MSRKLTLVTLALALALPGAFVTGAVAQGDDYPNRPVRLVAAAAPGGNPDVLARLLSQKLTAAFGKSFVVENVPGAGGVVAAKSVAAAPPDGHVLMLGDSGAMAINVVLNPDLGYDPLRDFTPITALVTVPTVLVVHSSVPAKTLAEFIALAKSKPGQLSYGSAGPGSIHHLTMAIFASQTGIDILHVPYRGGTNLVTGLLKGEVQAGWSGMPNVMPLIASNRIGVERGQKYEMTFYGSSFIAGPTGEKLTEADRSSEAVITATIDLEQVRAQRHAWGVFRDRRPDLYAPILTLDGHRPA